MAAGSFLNSGATRWWIVTAVLCGAAMGMVLSGLLALLIPMVMVVLRPMTCTRRARIVLASGAIAVAVYFLTNPYVLVHLLGDRAVLESNLRNTRAMYEIGRLLHGAVNAAKLMIEGASPLVMLVGLLGAVLIWRSRTGPQAAVLRILSAVSAVIVVQFVLLAAGKPGEYGRFAVLPDIVLGVCAAVLAGRARIRTFERVQVVVILVVLTVLPGIIYLRGFVRDATNAARRIEDAMLLEGLKQLGARRLGLWAEPAPYSLPPLDLFHWQIVLLPRGFDPLAEQAEAQYDVLLRPVDVLRTHPAAAGHRYRLISQRTFDDLFPSRISWAAKPFEIWVRADLLQQTRPATCADLTGRS